MSGFRDFQKMKTNSNSCILNFEWNSPVDSSRGVNKIPCLDYSILEPREFHLQKGIFCQWIPVEE